MPYLLHRKKKSREKNEKEVLKSKSYQELHNIMIKREEKNLLILAGSL